MDARLKNIIENFETMKIGVDDTFKFHCTMCGDCCRNREDIILSPKDVYRMSRELDLVPPELVERYCETYVGMDSRIPVVRLAPRGADRQCPLLREDQRCSVHKAKPTVCAMFPIGRCLMVETGPAAVSNLTSGQTQYIFSDPGCGDDSEEHTVREWLGEFDIQAEDAFFVKWNQLILTLSRQYKELEKTLDGHTMEMLWKVTFVGLYLSYDTDRDFMLQFEENAQAFLRFLDVVQKDNAGETHA